MSVCVAGLASDGKDIAFVSDTKAAFGDFSADKAVSKGEPLTFGYAIQFAGNDVARAGNVIRRASQKLDETNPNRHRLPPDDVAECVYRECKAERSRVQEAKVLAKHGYTYDLFTHSGKEICTDSVFYDIHAGLEATKLSLDFLIAGFDQNGDGHIRFTNSVTPPEDYDSIGFWAIGRGQHNALAYLSHAIEHLGLSKRTIQRRFYTISLRQSLWQNPPPMWAMIRTPYSYLPKGKLGFYISTVRNILRLNGKSTVLHVFPKNYWNQ